jgi:hypothetical protein
MHSVRLDDDAVVHAYKHLSTRRYCYLAEDGRAFLHTPAGDYLEVTRRRAIVVARVLAKLASYGYDGRP